jgi:hypothetical protein
MCTLTVVPGPNGRLRLAFNRDESRTRPPGLPPEVRQVGTRRVVLPTDPASGGTWLAVNDGGLALAVLNVNPRDEFIPVATRSRGTIIPALLHCDSPAAALSAFEQLFRYEGFAPFRLVLVGGGLLAEVRWDGREPMVMSRLLGGTPLMFTSSGLGDHLVECVRRELFDSFFEAPVAEWSQVQDTFHRHQWAGREHLSVNMARESARTVSHAVIEIDDRATFRYFAEPFDQLTETTTTLPLAVAGVP